jgi:hypothetical protein
MRLLIALLAALSLGGCATAPESLPADVALIAPDVRFVTPGPQELGLTLNAVQLVTARYGEEQFVFEGHVSASPQRVTLIAIDSLGRRALTATRTSDQLVFEPAPWVPESLRAANILADMAIVYWPEDAIRRALAGSTATLRSGKGDRAIVIDGREIVHVDYEGDPDEPWNGRARYRNVAFGYALDLRSVLQP